jgi:hypothetical protein
VIVLILMKLKHLNVSDTDLMQVDDVVLNPQVSNLQHKLTEGQILRIGVSGALLCCGDHWH